MPAAERDASLRVFVADSQAVIRSGVWMALEEQPGVDVVGEAGDLNSALEAIASLRPDVAVVELELLAGQPPQAVLPAEGSPAIVLLSRSNDAATLVAAMKAGAHAILSKHAPMEKLVDAALSVRDGRGWQPRDINRRLQAAGTTDEPEDVWAALTPREREVAVLVARGLPYKKVAQRLRISDHTVKNHLRRIYDKLDINSRVELAVHGADAAKRP